MTVDVLRAPAALSADLPALDARYSAVRSTSLFIRATIAGYQPIGMNFATGTVYLASDSTGRTLFACTDPDLTSIAATGFAFPAGTTLRQVFATSTNALLIWVTTAGVNNLYRSADGGVTASIVLAGFGNANTGTLQQNIAQNPVSGAIILCEYDAIPSADTFKTHKSTDDGATWADLETFVAPGGHIHGIFTDPTIAGRLWRCWGDVDAQCKIEYTADDGATWTTLGSGDQSWRAVALLFTPTEIVRGADTPTRPETVQAIDKVTLARRTLLPDAGNTVYFAAQDAVSATGRHMWATGSSAADGQGITLWTGKLDGSTPMQAALVPPPLPGATQNRMPMYGPDPNGVFYLAVTQIVPGFVTSKLAAVQLVDIMPSGKQVPLSDPQTSTKPSKATGIRIGPPPGLYATTQALNNGREFMNKFTAPSNATGLLTAVYVKNGGAVAGNISAAVRSTLANGNPGAVVAQTPAVAQAGIGAEQKLAFGQPFALIPGQDYWFTVCGTNAGGLIVGGGSTFDWAVGGQLARFLDNGAGVCPAPLAAPVGPFAAGYSLCAMLTTS